MARRIPPRMLTEIVKLVEPEKVICFGTRSTTTDSWSCFLPHGDDTSVATYDLLIITRADETRDRHALVDMLLKVNCPTARINPLVHSTHSVRESLRMQNRFFATVCMQGDVVYEKENSAPLLSHHEGGGAGAASHDEKSDKWFDLGSQFLQGALYFQARKCYRLSIFMLHQAVEHTSVGLILLMTGYRATTHNLGRLIAITENFTHCAASVFPQNTAEESDLFQLLNRAYSEARYKESYVIEPDKLRALIRRVVSYLNQSRYVRRKPLADASACSSIIPHIETQSAYEKTSA